MIFGDQMVQLPILDPKKLQHQLLIMYKFRQQSIKHNFRKFKPGRAHPTLLSEEYHSGAEDKHHVILNMTSVARGYILHSL